MDILSFDATEHLLDSIDTTRDLLSLALTSRFWAELIIPRHIEYRKLHLDASDLHLPLWAHLAERKDLAKNIREVRMTNIGRSWERLPTTLVPPVVLPLAEHQLEDRPDVVFLRAFQNFEHLESFKWQCRCFVSFMDPHRNHQFLQILSNAMHLSSLSLTWQWNIPRDETLRKPHPIFSFSNLTRLDLRGLFWISFNQVSLLTPLLLRCPDLEELSLFYPHDTPPFVTCFFPKLRKVFFSGTAIGGVSDDLVLNFIEAHNTIEELTWYPSTDIHISPGSLPAIKEILSTHEFTMSVLQDKSVPKKVLRSIGRISLDSTSMRDLEGIDGNHLQELYLWRYEKIQDIYRIAELFPTITTLEIPQLGMSMSANDSTLDDHIFTLSYFPALECILGTCIWTMILDFQGGKARQAAVTKLANACPNLRLITFEEPYTRQVILSRVGKHITWEECASTDS